MANRRFFSSPTAKWSASTALAVVLCAAGARADEPIVLDPITVEGDPGVVTEGTETYTWQRVTVGGKQPQANRDIPQTVAVVTRQAMDDISADSLEEASRILPSLTDASGDGFLGSLYSRGQEVFQFYVDGAPRPFLSIYGTGPDLYFFDRVEVMSGPSGVFQGSGEPVGTINMVRKRPTEELQGSAGVFLDSRASFRAQADIGGPVIESKRVRARIAAYGDHEESFVDVAERDTAGVYGTVEFDITPDTTISVGGIYDVSDTLRFSGLPTFADGGLVDVSRSTFIGSTENEAEIPTIDGFIELEHTFGFGGVLKATGRIFDQTADLRNLLSSSPVDRATGDFDVFWFARDYEQRAYYADVNFTAPLSLADRPLEIVGGADFRRVEQGFMQNFDFSPGTVNIATFDPGAFPLPTFTFPGVGPGFRLNTESTTDEYGLYAQARLDVTDAFRINLGGRLSFYEVESIDTGRNIVVENEETNFAPYVGLAYDVLENVTVYGSYASIFQPQSETDASGAVLEARIGQQVEVGIKTEHFGGALTAQASYYFIRDENRAQTDPVNPGASIASGEADTQGFEMLVTGSPYPGFEIIGGLAFVDTELTNDPTPSSNFSLFGKYTFQEGVLNGLSVGLGMRAVGEFDNESGGVTIRAPGYAVFDAYAGYEISENFSAQLNIYNLADREYVERVNTTARGTYFGRPLTAVFNLNAKF